jgi:lipid-binding SYLF domain-containing protein
MTKLVLVVLGTFVLALAWAAPAEREEQLLGNAGAAYRELLKVPDAEVPEGLLRDCRCIAVFPGVVKGAFAWGARRGHGVISFRASGGQWSAPLFMTMTGGSFGFQVGVEKSDLVLFVMNEKSARALVRNEFTLGARGGVAAGPLGRGAEGSTDIKLDAEIYSYARSKGLFAGISLEGARVSVDQKANGRFYGRAVTADEVLFDRKVDILPGARGFLSVLPPPPSGH